MTEQTWQEKVEAIANDPAVVAEKQNLREQKIDSRCLEILKDPLLFDKICKESQKFIKGEQQAVKHINLVSMGGKLVLNCDPASSNLAVNASSGTGKDAVVKASSCKFLTEEIDLFHRTKITPTAFTYWKRKAIEKDGFTWDQKVIYLEDVSGSVLNSPVFKTMLTGAGRATIVKDQREVEINVPGKPVIILTFAEFDQNNEMLRRVPLIHLDESENQTSEIIRFIARAKLLGSKPKVDLRIFQAVQCLHPVHVAVPFAEAIGASFEKCTGIAFRTHISRIIDYVAFSAAIHQFQRSYNTDGYVEATYDDYTMVRSCIAATTTNTKGYTFSHKQQSVIDVLRDADDPLSVPQLLVRGVKYSKKGLYKCVDKLRERRVLHMTNKEGVDFYELKSAEDFQDIPTVDTIIELEKRLKTSTPCTLRSSSTPSTLSTPSVPSVPSVLGKRVTITEPFTSKGGTK